ncbi:hypothetical protein NE237_011968 [Protea cynaroides]|uniref:Uncharacterized protein n=1 Tax=Protea cynaroides TaxID=273540 RepID=A0A9Q0GX69_9MAGN|nr:hypothetical protein NE237_011968 [Protea cynaroides]
MSNHQQSQLSLNLSKRCSELLVFTIILDFISVRCLLFSGLTCHNLYKYPSFPNNFRSQNAFINREPSLSQETDFCTNLYILIVKEFIPLCFKHFRSLICIHDLVNHFILNFHFPFVVELCLTYGFPETIPLSIKCW